MIVRLTPIIFCGPLVLAILGRAKTVTRRLMRVRRDAQGRAVLTGPSASIYATDEGLCYLPPGADAMQRCSGPQIASACPYGGPGAELWVREAWAAWFDVNHREQPWHKTPRELRTRERLLRIAYRASEPGAAPRWVTPLFMPLWASRLRLQLTEVDGQRLHAITNEDAEREGVSWGDLGGAPALDARSRFAALWQSLNAERSPWDRNDFVWRLAFQPKEMNP